MIDIYGGQDPRDIPSYSIVDAARYLRIPAGTISSWTIGRIYFVADRKMFFQPLIPIKEQKPRLKIYP